MESKNTFSNLPLVSIIINCYNSEKYLKEAIDSIYNQTYSNWEIILIDNCSTDKTAEIAQSYSSKLKYFKTEQNIKLGKARNIALENCAGTYIGFLDSDDIWQKEKLLKQVEVLNQNPDTDLCYTNYHQLYESRNELQVAFKKEQPSGEIYTYSLSNFPIGILTTVITKKALLSLKSYFDSNLNLAEDFDFFMRILKTHKGVYISTPLATYRIHSQMHTITHNAKFPAEVIHTYHKLLIGETDTHRIKVIQNCIKKEKIKDLYYNTLKEKGGICFILNIIQEGLTLQLIKKIIASLLKKTFSTQKAI